MWNVSQNHHQKEKSISSLLLSHTLSFVGFNFIKKFKSLSTMSQHLPQNLDVITEQAVASSSGLSSTATWDIAKDYMVESFLDEGEYQSQHLGIITEQAVA